MAPLPLHPIDKLDLLLVVDNSDAMAEKQAILAEAVPALLTPLLQPPCLDDAGQPLATQPGPGNRCPAGSWRRYEPLRNVHIGVVSSSLGGHGADVCFGSESPTENDRGRLIARSHPAPGAPAVPTWNDEGFLVWDPSVSLPTRLPPGLSDQSELFERLGDMVQGAGTVGCSYEAPLEAWYRFLIDPDPHIGVSIENGVAITTGTDQAVLDQRHQFLRPDSVLMVVMLSDENDCSVRDGGQFYLALQQQVPGQTEPFHLPKPRAACAEDPASDCCQSCAQVPGKGCDDSGDDCAQPLAAIEDHHNLRCFDQKRRFGVDFAYPLDRYVAGLTQTYVSDRYGNSVRNPIFDDSKLDESVTVRGTGMVFLAGIVGVPWQDLARRNDAGEPDLLAGLNIAGTPVGGYQSYTQMWTLGTWPLIAGFPSVHQPPTDPFMVESVEPRAGQNFATGEVIQPADAAEGASAVNGHERTIVGRDDLQYACIFPLAEARDCSDPTVPSCACGDPANDDPLCVSNPNDGGQRTLQKYDKAYPGIRQLAVLRDMEERGISGSICPAQRHTPTSPDYGYRPAVSAAIERVTRVLIRSRAGTCLNEPDEYINCRMVAAMQTDSCDCHQPGYTPIEKKDARLVVDSLLDAEGGNAAYNCFCEVTQLSGDALTACQQDDADPPLTTAGEEAHGWCYLSSFSGNPALLDTCGLSAQQKIRFTGNAKPAIDTAIYLGCRD